MNIPSKEHLKEKLQEHYDIMTGSKNQTDLDNAKYVYEFLCVSRYAPSQRFLSEVKNKEKLTKV